jgi:hypothetical protein
MPALTYGKQVMEKWQVRQKNLENNSDQSQDAGASASGAEGGAFPGLEPWVQ